MITRRNRVTQDKNMIHTFFEDKLQELQELFQIFPKKKTCYHFYTRRHGLLE